MFVVVSEGEIGVANCQNLEAFVEQVAASRLPGFVLHEAGASYEEAIDLVAMPLENQGFSFIGRRVALPGDSVSEPDKEWHIGLPDTEGQDTNFITTEYTLKGTITRRLVVPTLEYAKHINSETNRRLIRLARVGLGRGTVEPEVFKPHCLQTVTKAGSLFVFRSGGRLPLAYQSFVTETPRHSYAGVAGRQGLNTFAPDPHTQDQMRRPLLFPPKGF